MIMQLAKAGGCRLASDHQVQMTIDIEESKQFELFGGADSDGDLEILLLLSRLVHGMTLITSNGANIAYFTAHVLGSTLGDGIASSSQDRQDWIGL
jgi:hypothetical protein